VEFLLSGLVLDLVSDLESDLVSDFGLESEPDLLFSDPLSEEPEDSLLPESPLLLLADESATFRLLSFLKSVSYHPLPLSLKPDAEISLRNAAFPQAGQSVSGASLMR
jgi:hypothetical protein